MQIRILCLSGETVSEMKKYVWPSGAELDTTTLTASLIVNRHVAPSCPDTACMSFAGLLIGCYPFEENDPFILRECPNVLVIGNQDNFSRRTVKGCLIPLHCSVQGVADRSVSYFVCLRSRTATKE